MASIHVAVDRNWLALDARLIALEKRMDDARKDIVNIKKRDLIQPPTTHAGEQVDGSSAHVFLRILREGWITAFVSGTILLASFIWFLTASQFYDQAEVLSRLVYPSSLIVFSIATVHFAFRTITENVYDSTKGQINTPPELETGFTNFAIEMTNAVKKKYTNASNEFVAREVRNLWTKLDAEAKSKFAASEKKSKSTCTRSASLL